MSVPFEEIEGTAREWHHPGQRGPHTAAEGTVEVRPFGNNQYVIAISWARAGHAPSTLCFRRTAHRRASSAVPARTTTPTTSRNCTVARREQDQRTRRFPREVSAGMDTGPTQRRSGAREDARAIAA